MGNASQVEEEMSKYAEMKWRILMESGGNEAGNLVVEAIKEDVPVDTGAAQSSIDYDILEMGMWIFKICTCGKDVRNPRTNISTLSYLSCLELGGPCTHNQNRPPHFFFRNGSLKSKDKMDQILAKFW